MSDIDRIPQGSPNYPPTNPVTTARQSQKSYFPFDAFSFDDPNQVANPVLRVKGPWSFWSARGFKTVSNAGYSFTDNDGVEVLLVTTGASGQTVSWASLTTVSAGRLFLVIKADSGAGAVTLSGTISGVSSPTLAAQYNEMLVYFDGTALYRISSIPLPIAFLSGVTPLPTTSAGAGQWKAVVSNNSWTLPSGGTWAYFGFPILSNSSVPWSSAVGGVLAGGTLVGGSLGASYNWNGFCYEVLDALGFDDTRPIYARDDGSFVITAETGHPYHVLTHEQAEAQTPRSSHDTLYDRVAAYVAEHPEAIQPEPKPNTVAIDPEVQLNQEILVSLIEGVKGLPKWRARLAQLKGEK